MEFILKVLLDKNIAAVNKLGIIQSHVLETLAKSIIVIENQPEGIWYINFNKYNASDDIEVTEDIAKQILDHQMVTR